jgi:hypothetical protein
MNRNTERLNAIYDKTDGYCHLCHRKFAFKNYGIRNAKGGWHIEHSIARANGGTDHLNNLYAACIPCNEDKGIQHTRSVRNRNGVTRAPHCRTKKQQIRESNSTVMGSIGLLIGSGLGGPVGAFIGAVIGSEIGKGMSPKK